MKALISPLDSVPTYVSSYTEVEPATDPVTWIANYTEIANAQRVCEVALEEFEVSLPLFWVDCTDDCVADEWYYNTESNTIVKKPADATFPPE